MNYTNQQIFEIHEQERLEKAYLNVEATQKQIKRIYEALLSERKRAHLRTNIHSKAVIESVIYHFRCRGFSVATRVLKGFETDKKAEHYIFECK